MAEDVTPPKPTFGRLPPEGDAATGPAKPDPRRPLDGQKHSALGEETLAVYAYTTATLLGLAAGFGMLLMLFWNSTPLAVMLPWMLLFVGLWFARVFLAQAFRRVVRKHGESTDFARWHLYWTILTLSSGAAWGLSGWIFYDAGTGHPADRADRHHLHLLHRRRAGAGEPAAHLPRLRRAVLRAADRAHRDRRATPTATSSPACC